MATKPPIAHRIDLVLAPLATELKLLGFRKSKRTFWRPDEAVTPVVEAWSRGQDNSGARGAFALDLGLLLWDVERALGHRAPPRITTTTCTLRERVAGPKNGTWAIDAETDLDVLGKRIMKAYRSKAAPWFERGSTLRGALALARAGATTATVAGSLVPVAILVALGDKAEASELLRRELATCPPAATGFARTAQRLGKKHGLLPRS